MTFVFPDLLHLGMIIFRSVYTQMVLFHFLQKTNTMWGLYTRINFIYSSVDGHLDHLQLKLL